MLKNTKELVIVYTETLPKAQQTLGLRSAYQSSNTNFQIKFHIQNLKQALTSKSQPKLSISNKLKIQNIDQS